MMRSNVRFGGTQIILGAASFLTANLVAGSVSIVRYEKAQGIVLLLLCVTPWVRVKQ